METQVTAADCKTKKLLQLNMVEKLNEKLNEKLKMVEKLNEKLSG